MTVSIITCLKADDADLMVTYDSIRPQLGGGIKWVVKCSEQCTKEFLALIPPNKDIKVIVAPDSGLYDALNQALHHCATDFYCVLGAGDALVPTACTVFESDGLDQSTHVAFFYGVVLKSKNHVLIPNPQLMNIKMACPHPGSVLRTALSLEINGYDTSYKIASDYDHLCRYLQKYGDCKTSEETLVVFKGGGMSDERWFEGALEEELIRIRRYESNIFAVFGRLLSIISTQLSGLLALNFK
jgi:hypothetical protein